MTIFASWYCTMKPLTTSGKGSISENAGSGTGNKTEMSPVWLTEAIR